MLFETAARLPLVVWVMRGFLRSLPSELIEAAMLDGCTLLQAFLRVVVPLRKAEMMLEEVHGLADWEPAAEGALEPSEALFAAVCAEKDAALVLAERHRDAVAAAATDLPEPGRGQLLDTFDLQVHYVRIFRACARACFAARLARAQPAARPLALREHAGLDAARAALAARLAGTRYHYLVHWMLDEARLTSLSADLRQLLASARIGTVA